MNGTDGDNNNMIPTSPPAHSQMSHQFHPPSSASSSQTTTHTAPLYPTLLSSSNNRRSIPTSQIEAMPPSAMVSMPSQSLVPAFNPATLHPVFFTTNFRKPPFPMPANAASNPVASGYAFARDRVHSKTKL